MLYIFKQIGVNQALLLEHGKAATVDDGAAKLVLGAATKLKFVLMLESRI